MKRDRKVNGFTLIELITVIVIIGVLAAVVGPRFASTDLYEERTFYDDVIQAIRYTQAKAIGSGCWTQITFSSTGFEVAVDSDCDSGTGLSAVDVVNPDGFARGYRQRQTPPATMAYIYPVNPIVFDAVGRPRNSSLDMLSATTTITVGGREIKVEGATGYVR